MQSRHRVVFSCLFCTVGAWYSIVYVLFFSLSFFLSLLHSEVATHSWQGTKSTNIPDPGGTAPLAHLTLPVSIDLWDLDNPVSDFPIPNTILIADPRLLHP
jgi:hypothetical protein